jgi:hypothetical protein
MPITSGHGPAWQVVVDVLRSPQHTWPGWQVEALVQPVHIMIEGSPASGAQVSPDGQSADESQVWMGGAPYGGKKTGPSSGLSSLASRADSLPSGESLPSAPGVWPPLHATVVAESVPTRRA